MNIYGGTVTAIGGETADQLTHGIGRGWVLNGNATRGHLYVHEGMVIKHGSREDLPTTTSTEARDPETHEFTFASQSPAFRWFFIEPEGHTSLAADADLGTVVKGDRYFSRSLGMRMSDGIPPYTFALTSMDERPGNRLPGGLELSDSGSLSGTPTEAGTFSFWITVADSDIGSYHRTADIQFTLKVYDTYSLMYYEQDGTTRVFPLPATYSYVEGTGIAEEDMPVPTKVGYDFAGWYTDTGLTEGPVASITASDSGNKTFYAKWTPTVYSIAYNGATPAQGWPVSYTVESADVILPASVEKDGFYFAGWYDNPQYSGSAVKNIPAGSTGERTFHAKWEQAGLPFAPVADKDELCGDAGGDGAWDLAQTVGGGKRPYTFALKDEPGNALPDGLALSADGELTGSIASAGVYTFTVEVTDDSGSKTEVEYTVEIAFAKARTDALGRDAVLYIGCPGSIDLATAISGGRAPYTFSVATEYAEYEPLPAGMALVGSRLEGTPTAVGDSHFVLEVTDANGFTSDLFYWVYVKSDSAQEHYMVNGVDWGWVSAAPPKETGTLSIWNTGATAAIPVETAGSVHVPSHIGAIATPVTCIGGGAFKDCAAVTRVTLPETITDIGEGAFSGCTSLKELVVRSGAVHINSGAFDGCANLATVYVEPGDANRVRTLFAASGCAVSGMQFVESAFCTLTLDANGGTALDEPSLIMVQGATIGTLPVPSRANYDFNGWYAAQSGGNPVTAETIISGDTTLHAQWVRSVAGPAIYATQTDLGRVKVGVYRYFNMAEMVAGGIPPYILSLASELPPGFEFDAETGRLSCTPEEKGVFTVKMKVQDDNGLSQTEYLKYIIRVYGVDAMEEGEPDEYEAGELVHYKTADGEKRMRRCKLVHTYTKDLSTGWYYATGDLSLSNGVTVSGNVCLILGDDARLTVTTPKKVGAAVEVAAADGETNSLTIYGQSRGTGVLNAIGVGGPGIGGFGSSAAGRLTVSGGVVVAQGDESAAGIGGGLGCAGGAITVNRGMVTAIGGLHGPGIGGGKGGDGATVRVNGGTVTAIGGSASGIGGRLYVGEGMAVTHGRREGQPVTGSGETFNAETDEFTFDAQSQYFRWFLIKRESN